MPILNQSSIDRIGRVVSVVETRFEDATHADDPGVFAQPWVWHQLTEPLDSDTLSAKAQPGLWIASAEDGAGRLYADSDEDHLHTVRDTTRRFGPTKGDWVLCRPIGSQNGTVWEIVAPALPPDRYGRTDAVLEKDGKVTVSLWTYDSDSKTWKDTGEDQEDVYDSFFYRGLMMPSGVQVRIRYSPENSRWEIVEVPWLEGTLSSQLLPEGDMSATVNISGISKVYAPLGMTEPIESGSWVKIAWDSRRLLWEVRMRGCAE